MTSGAVLLTTDSKFGNEISKLFRNGGIQKTYYARVLGNFAELLVVAADENTTMNVGKFFKIFYDKKWK